MHFRKFRERESITSTPSGLGVLVAKDVLILQGGFFDFFIYTQKSFLPSFLNHPDFFLKLTKKTYIMKSMLFISIYQLTGRESRIYYNLIAPEFGFGEIEIYLN